MVKKDSIDECNRSQEMNGENGKQKTFVKVMT